MNKDEWPISFSQWTYWLGATITACLSIMVFLYTTFQTKVDAAEGKMDLEHRLERIEMKLDKALMRKR